MIVPIYAKVSLYKKFLKVVRGFGVTNLFLQGSGAVPMNVVQMKNVQGTGFFGNL
jgi:hypothetical protein